MDGLASAGNRVISFMEFLTGNHSNAIQFLHSILNPNHVNTVDILIASHGELDYAKMTHEEESGVKLSIANIAPPGTVNWSDNKVNIGILHCFDKLYRDDEFRQYLPALTSGNPNQLPQMTTLNLTLDEIFFAAMCRLLHCFEMDDDIHRGSTLQSGPPESLTSSSLSYALNLFTTKPTIMPRLVVGQPQPRIMTDQEVMDCMTTFRVKIISGKLAEFNKYLQAHNIQIILPSSIQFPKLYSLPKEEHTSLGPTKLAPRTLNVSTKSPEEKQYEHKIVAFIRIPDGLTDAAFIGNIHNLLQSSGNIECYNRMASQRNYIDLRNGLEIKVPTGVAGLFEDQLLVDIREESKFWNKLCIIVETGAGRLGTLVQWHVEPRRGGLKYLVFNIWNMISGKMHIVQTAQGQDNSTATTKDITDFVTKVLGLTPTGIAIITDATCHVPGGSDLGEQSSWVYNPGPLDSRLSAFIPKLAFSHADSIRSGERRQRASSHDLLRDFVYGLTEKINEVFTLCNDRSKTKKEVIHRILADPTHARHADTSLPNVSFRSVPEVLERLLGDNGFIATGVSSFGISVIVDVLQYIELPIVGINTQDRLKRFGICVCKYLHDMSKFAIECMNSFHHRNFHDAFEKFYDAVHLLKIDKHTFKINTPGGGYQDFLTEQLVLANVKHDLQPYHRLDARVDKNRQELHSRPTQHQLDTLGKLEGRLKTHAKKKDEILSKEVDGLASMMDPKKADTFMTNLYDAAGFVADIRDPSYYRVINEQTIEKIQRLIDIIYNYCNTFYDIGTNYDIGTKRQREGGKKTKTRQGKRNKSRNFRNKSRVRRTRRRVIKRKNN